MSLTSLYAFEASLWQPSQQISQEQEEKTTLEKEVETIFLDIIRLKKDFSHTLNGKLRTFISEQILLKKHVYEALKKSSPNPVDLKTQQIFAELSQLFLACPPAPQGKNPIDASPKKSDSPRSSQKRLKLPEELESTCHKTYPVTPKKAKLAPGKGLTEHDISAHEKYRWYLDLYGSERSKFMSEAIKIIEAFGFEKNNSIFSKLLRFVNTNKETFSRDELIEILIDSEDLLFVQTDHLFFKIGDHFHPIEEFLYLKNQQNALIKAAGKAFHESNLKTYNQIIDHKYLHQTGEGIYTQNESGEYVKKHLFSFVKSANVKLLNTSCLNAATLMSAFHVFASNLNRFTLSPPKIQISTNDQGSEFHLSYEHIFPEEVERNCVLHTLDFLTYQGTKESLIQKLKTSEIGSYGIISESQFPQEGLYALAMHTESIGVPLWHFEVLLDGKLRIYKWGQFEKSIKIYPYLDQFIEELKLL